MYKVLIVDDEDLIREGLKTFARWDTMGFEVVGEASDGDEALELVQKLKPHVVVTDIKMPRCTGIELMKKINEAGLNTKIVVLSGYDEFEYAKAALEAGAVDYLLKPIKFDKLREVLGKIKDEYDRKIRENIKINKALELLKNEFFLKVIDGVIARREDILQQAKEVDISFEWKYFLTVIIEIDNYHELISRYSAQDMDLYKFAIKNVAEEICSRYGKGYAFTRDNGEVAVVFCSDASSREFVKSMLNEIKKGIDSVLEFTVTVSCGDEFGDITMLKQSYMEARKRADMKFSLGKNRVILPEDADTVEKKEAPVPDNADNIESRLLLHIQNQDMEGISLLLEQAFSGMTQRDAIYDRFYSIIKLLSRFMEKNGAALSDITDENLFKYEHVVKKETLEDIIADLKSVINGVMAYLNQTNYKSVSKVLNEVKEYVNRHLGEDISLETVAQRVYMHPMYLSKLFKKETGVNFIDYLTSARVEQAKRLMQDITLKTYEISEMVGYKSPKHFSKVFKSVTGVTPKDYRRNILGYDE